MRAILAAAALLALISARPYAGGWNDGSRLATVESLVERGTFQIDDSIYVQPSRAAQPPFDPAESSLLGTGTKDRMFIEGHYYSDKPPVQSLLMAGAWRILRALGLPPAAERPDWFARVLTWLFAGVPFVLATWCTARTAQHLRVPERWRLALAASFAFGTLAAPYAQQVNAHVLLLGVAAALCEVIFRPGAPTRGRAAWQGALAGAAYAIDLGAGPLLALAAGGHLLWRRAGVAAFAAGAAPWIALHHALNYAIAGTLGPAAARPEHFQWPGSPFHAGNLTGPWLHDSVSAAAVYALVLLFGPKGFVWFSLPLVQTAAGARGLLGDSRPERPALLAFAGFALATWLLYAASSNNQSGSCLSIRWLLPLLAPGFAALMVLVRDVPAARRPLAVLIAGGLGLAPELIAGGPWDEEVRSWPLIPLALAAWAWATAGAWRPAPAPR